MHSYHNVAKLRQFRGVLPAALRLTPQMAPITAVSLAAAPVDLNIEIADLLAQRVAVETQKIGGTNLIAPGSRQRCRQQRNFDLLEDPVVEAGRRHAIGKSGKMRRQ